jgi:hypothetical protein
MHELGELLKTYGLNWLQLLQRFALGLFIPFVIAAVIWETVPGSFPSFEVAAPYALLGAVILFLLTGLYLSLRRPRIRVYEHGVGLRQQGEERTWRWAQITRMDGTRHYQYVNGIPVWATGANHIYAGNERIFDIAVLTNGANELAGYIQMKMAQNHLPNLIAAYRAGEAINFNILTVNHQGISTVKGQYPWPTITDARVRFGWLSNENNARLMIEREGQKPQKIGGLPPVQGYYLMGLLDAIRGQNHFAELQARYLKSRIKPGCLSLYTAVWGFILIAVVLVISVTTLAGLVNEGQAQARRDAFVSAFRPGGQVLCQPRPGSSDAPLSLTDARLLVVQPPADEAYQPYHDALSAEQQATSRTDLTHLVCVDIRWNEVEDCEYVADDSERVLFHIRRFRSTVYLTLIDAATNQTLLEDRLRGERPTECPDEAESGHADIYGTLPDGAAFQEWLNDLNEESNPDSGPIDGQPV